MSKCDTCIYRASSTVPWKCDYIFIVGQSRGCEPGNECIEYEKGDRLGLTNSAALEDDKSFPRHFKF